MSGNCYGIFSGSGFSDHFLKVRKKPKSLIADLNNGVLWFKSRVWGFLLGDFYDQDQLLRLSRIFWSQQNFQNDGVRVYFQKIEVLFFLAKVPTFQDTGGIFYDPNCIFIGHNFSITRTFLCSRWFFKIMITTFCFFGALFSFDDLAF